MCKSIAGRLFATAVAAIGKLSELLVVRHGRLMSEGSSNLGAVMEDWAGFEGWWRMKKNGEQEPKSGKGNGGIQI